MLQYKKKYTALLSLKLKILKFTIKADEIKIFFENK